MGLIRLFLYDRPMSMKRFIAELSVALLLIALTTGLATVYIINVWLK